MLVPSFSVSLQPPVLRPSAHHYSPFQVTSSCFFRSPGSPELSLVYKLPLEKRAEPHFKGHGLPQASVLSREIGMTNPPPTLLPAPLPASPLFRVPPLHAHAPSCLPSDGAPPGQVIPPDLREGAGLHEGFREEGREPKNTLDDDWTRSSKGGKPFRRGRKRRFYRGVSLQACDWQPAGSARGVRCWSRWLSSRAGVDGVRGGQVNSGKAASGGRENEMSSLSPATGTWYCRGCHFPALGRKEGKV